MTNTCLSGTPVVSIPGVVIDVGGAVIAAVAGGIAVAVAVGSITGGMRSRGALNPLKYPG